MSSHTLYTTLRCPQSGTDATDPSTSTWVNSDAEWVIQIMPTFTKCLWLTVVNLHVSSSPSNVTGLVSAFVIDPVQRQFWTRFETDMIEERLKVMQPFVADSDASTAVTVPGLAVRVEASLPHAVPCDPLWGGAHTMGDGSSRHSGESLGREFTSEAPAGLRSPSSEVAGIRDGLASAVTVTEPARVASTRQVLDSFDDDEASELLAGQIDESHRRYSTRLDWIRTE